MAAGWFSSFFNRRPQEPAMVEPGSMVPLGYSPYQPGEALSPDYRAQYQRAERAAYPSYDAPLTKEDRSTIMWQMLLGRQNPLKTEAYLREQRAQRQFRSILEERLADETDPAKAEQLMRELYTGKYHRPEEPGQQVVEVPTGKESAPGIPLMRKLIWDKSTNQLKPLELPEGGEPEAFPKYRPTRPPSGSSADYQARKAGLLKAWRWDQEMLLRMAKQDPVTVGEWLSGSSKAPPVFMRALRPNWQDPEGAAAFEEELSRVVSEGAAEAAKTPRQRSIGRIRFNTGPGQ